MVKEPVDRFVKAEHESLSCSFFSRLYTLTQNGHGASWLAYQCRTRANVSPGLFQGCRPWPKVGGQEASQWVCQRRTWGRTPLQREGLLTWTSYLPVQHIHMVRLFLSTAYLLTMTSTAITSYREGLLTWTSCIFLQHTHMVRLFLSTACLLTMTSTAMTSYREGLLTWTSCIFLQHTHMVRLFLSTASLLTMTSTAMTSYREGLLTWTSCIFLQHTHMVRLFLSTACLLTMTSTVMTSYREGLLTWTSCIFLQHTHMVRLLYQQHVCWLEHLVYQYNACMWSDLLQWQQISQRSTTDNHSSSSQVATVSFLLVAF